jgi:glycosyltransferase involved in cell wall biosynthesis
VGLKQKIVLITSGQPSLNPRLVKEADSLFEAGYDVTVVYLYWNNWGTDLDKQLLSEKKWKSIRVGGNPKSGKWIYWLSRIRHKLSNILLSKLDYRFILPELSIARGSLNLMNKVEGLKADLYIAHNLGALPAAIIAAKNNHAKCGFDAEDFHRQEVTNNYNSKDFKLKKHIEDKYLPKLDYLTTASPLISETYKKLYPAIHPETILNVFPSERERLKKTKKNLKLFWFSQNIGKDRGLEEVISSLAYQEDVELHLLGFSIPPIKEYFRKLSEQNSFRPENIHYYSPIPSNEIIKFASQFDIGLATETGIPLNRDICLTNKIFTYIQSGLAIIASDTSAQKWLLESYPKMGFIYNKAEVNHLTSIIQNYLSNPELLEEHQAKALKYAHDDLNWEHEEKKFLKKIVNTIGK